MRIGIVVNPRARGAQDPRLPGRLQALGERPGIACQTVTTARPEDLPETVAGLGALDVLGVCGGDGTLMATLSALLAAPAGALPALLLMPAGTMNTVAKNLGLPPRPEALLRATLAAAQPGGLSAVPFWPQETLRVRTYGETPYSAAPPPAAAAPLTEALLQALPRRERCGFLFSGAMGARFLAAYASVPQPGLQWAVVLALRTIASCLYPGGGTLARWLFQPTPTRLTVDCGDEAAVQLAGAFRLLLLATVSDAGLGMRVPWRAGCVPGRFQLIASAISTMQNALQLPRIWRAQPLRGTPHHDLLARAAKLRFASPQPLVLDGELFCAAAVDVELGPRLRVLRPPLVRAGARL
jgi:diacylglycerol kinase family enzyme